MLNDCGNCENLNGPCPDHSAQRQADAQALADVRTLDAYLETLPYVWSWELTRFNGSWAVVFTDGNRSELELAPTLEGETPDASRHEAAEWVRKQAKGAE